MFASGKTSAKIFIKMNRKWIKDDNFVLGGGAHTLDTFNKLINNSMETGRETPNFATFNCQFSNDF